MTNPPRPRPLPTALIYDFDGTLAPGNIQEHSLLRDYLQADVDEFWREVGKLARKRNGDRILVYMQQLLTWAKQKQLPITEEVLREHGRDVPFFEGVESWFARINKHAAEHGLALEHYVISSGNEEMMAATRIAREFKHIFGCRYAYDESGQAVWPAVAINYTTKTQFLFRINKGVLNSHDDEAVNRWSPMASRPMPFERMIYLGDGDTDIPSMKMVRHQGGHSIAVFDPKKWQEEGTQKKVYKLIAEDRAHFVVPADYRAGSQLDISVRGILGRIATAHGVVP